MCYVCRCFGWMLDLLQRILTFLLACIMSCAICIGVMLAVGAGIAYGYNYSLAEFLTFTRSDITVYVRRGQFADRPEVQPYSRRTGNDGKDILDGNELFSSNFSADYQDQNKVTGDDSKPLSDAWQKAQDTRAYAEKLTKYSKIKPAVRPYPRAGDDEEVPRLLQPEETNSDSSLYPDETHEDNEYPMNRPTISTTVNEEPFARRKLEPIDPQSLHMNTPTESNVTSSLHSDLGKSNKKSEEVETKFRKPDVKIQVVDNSKSLYLQPYNITRYTNEDYSEDIEYLDKPV